MTEEEVTALKLLDEIDMVDLERWFSMGSRILAFFRMVQYGLQADNKHLGFFTFEEMSKAYHSQKENEELKKLNMTVDSFVDSWVVLSPQITGIIGGGSIDSFFPFGVEIELGRDDFGLGDHIEHHVYCLMVPIHDEHGFWGGFKFVLRDGRYPSCKRFRRVKKMMLGWFVKQLEEQYEVLVKKARERNEEDWKRAEEERKTIDAKAEIRPTHTSE